MKTADERKVLFQQAQKPWGSTHSSAVLSAIAFDYLNGMGFDDNQYAIVHSYRPKPSLHQGFIYCTYVKSDSLVAESRLEQ